MQTTFARASTKRVAPATAARAASVRPLRVVCKAQNVSEAVKKVAAAAIALPAMIAASPAFALVDDRLNGDGTGLPFGVNDGALGWCMVGGLATVWALWFNAQKDLGDFEDPEAGLKIED